MTKDAYLGDNGVLASITNKKSVIDCATLSPKDMEWSYEEVKKRGGFFLEGKW